MTLSECLMRPLHMLPPEAAHRAAIHALRSGLLPAPSVPRHSALSQTLWGLSFPNPLGIAAGFDKNAEAIDGLLAQGFGFVEVGTVTPLPQKGNAKPRMFRLSEDKAVINRLGFNNDGMKTFIANLASRKTPGVVGANIGKNKNSEDAVADYVTLLRGVYAHADYITVNISSPNTVGLRALQGKQQLKELLMGVMHARKEVATAGRLKPLLIKIAPDLTDEQKSDIVEVALAYNIEGLIVSNTTVSRPALNSAHKGEQGGLSGKPLFELSTQTLCDIYSLTQGKIPLIGVGGIASGEDAWVKLAAGASLVQVYTAFVYQGFGLVGRINRYIAERMRKEGIKTIGEIVGSGLRA